MGESRTVNYTIHKSVKDGDRPFAYRREKQENRGYFLGVVRGATKLSGGEYSAYDYGLVEDYETGQLMKIELTDIVFTDRMTPKALEDLLEKM